MTEQQGDGIWQIGWLVEVMYVEGREPVYFDRSVEVGQGIQSGLLRFPIEAVLPVLRQTFHVGKGSAVVEAGVFELI